MIVEFQFGTRLLRATLRKAAVREVTIEQLDATTDVPLRTVCWLETDAPGEFEDALAADRTVLDATRVVTTNQGSQFQVTHAREFPGTDVYYAAVERDGIFVSGRTDGKSWVLQMRFPHREAFAEFREATDSELSVQAIYDQEAAPYAEQYSISPPQREILLLAADRGYFEVPRQASLADLADELDVSSQAASERLRRGLDALVERALLTPE